MHAPHSHHGLAPNARNYVGQNAILIVEFAKAELEKGQSVVAAPLNGARVRLRPILMTSFAFIFGLYPLWNALGAGGEARRLIGTVADNRHALLHRLRDFPDTDALCRGRAD